MTSLTSFHLKNSNILGIIEDNFDPKSVQGIYSLPTCTFSHWPQSLTLSWTSRLAIIYAKLHTRKYII